MGGPKTAILAQVGHLYSDAVGQYHCVANISAVRQIVFGQNPHLHVHLGAGGSPLRRWVGWSSFGTRNGSDGQSVGINGDLTFDPYGADRFPRSPPDGGNSCDFKGPGSLKSLRLSTPDGIRNVSLGNPSRF